MDKTDAFVPRKRFRWDKAAHNKETPGNFRWAKERPLLLLDIPSDQQAGRRKDIDMIEALEFEERRRMSEMLQDRQQVGVFLVSGKRLGS